MAKILGRMGFRRYGQFYIGTCNDDVLSGYCLDSPPGTIYVWRFVLPTFDDHSFLHLALGTRIFAYSQEEPITEVPAPLSLLQRDWAVFSELKDSGNLIAYMDKNKMDGTYSNWTRYLTHIWCERFDEAERIIADPHTFVEFSQLKAISHSFSILVGGGAQNNWGARLAVLREWAHKTKSSYC